MPSPDSSKLARLYLLRSARGKAKKDVGHGGLDEWFSGHGGAKGKGEGATWGDWVAISPVERTLKKPDGKTKKIKPGDIVGPCGISKKKEWKEFTNNGKDPLKCMPRQKAYDMPKKERADIAKGKMKAEKKDKGEGKKTTKTPTFKDKKAKVTGTKTGDGEHVGLFIPLPKHLAKKFPDLGEEDDSPSHVTLLYIGEFKDSEKLTALEDAIERALSKWPSKIKAELDKLEYFDHEDKDRRVPHVSVKFDENVDSLRKSLKKSLAKDGFEIEDNYPTYNPHVTLAYLPGMNSEWEGDTPKGSWSFGEVELWGSPQLRKFRLGAPSVRSVAASWLRSKLARTLGGTP